MEGSRLVRYVSRSQSVVVPKEVEILSRFCFSHSSVQGPEPSTITFGSESQLKRIEERCFWECALKSICIPRNVDFIDGSAFCCCRCQCITVDPHNPRFSIDRDFLIDKIEIRLIRYFGSSTHVHIWKDIEILGVSCFDGYGRLGAIAFEEESQLTRIEKFCFGDCQLKSICIPRNVDFTDGSAFASCICQSITVDPHNPRFSMDQDFLIDKIDIRLIRYFGSSNRVHIWSDIKILGMSCFEGCRELAYITFNNESRLTHIEDWCLACCPIKSICIPRTVEVLGKECFHKSRKLELIKFESESRLTRIGDSCFACCQIKSICIPRTVEILDKKMLLRMPATRIDGF
jgi:hypothetical protein